LHFLEQLSYYQLFKNDAALRMKLFKIFDMTKYPNV